jgi:hypothetical protein
MRNRIATISAASAVAAGLLFGSAVPATAAPVAVPSVSTSIAPALGLSASAYHIQCNWYGVLCYKKRFYIPSESRYITDICSNYNCTKRTHYAAHPPLSKATWY